MKMPWEDDKIYYNQATSNKFGYSPKLIDGAKKIDMSKVGNDIWKMMNHEKKGERKTNVINHIRRWNKWRKGNLNGRLYKFLVLIGVKESPTLPLIWLDSELKAYRKDLEDALYGEPNFLSKHEEKWVERENDNAVEVLTKQH